MDEIRGDQEFYEKELKPYIEDLKEHANLISSKISPEEAEKYFDEYVPEWHEFKYKVAHMRSEFLKKQLFSE